MGPSESIAMVRAAARWSKEGDHATVISVRRVKQQTRKRKGDNGGERQRLELRERDKTRRDA